ncbi:MAG: hypothetical protein AAF411_09715 [Myxococcota bacterium]
MKGRFGASLLFATIAALAVLPWMHYGTNVFGRALAAHLYLVISVAAHAAFLLRRDSDEATSMGVRIGLLGLGLLLVTASLPQTALGCALLLAIGRGGLLARRISIRAFAQETALVAGGLVSASVMLDGSDAGFAGAIWAFYLVQTAFTLLDEQQRPPSPSPQHSPYRTDGNESTDYEWSSL